MNIDERSVKKCTSCQMCAAVCPKNAISIFLDKKGFYRPRVDGALCVNCGLCTTVCYKFDDHIETYDSTKLSNTLLYSAYAQDNEIVKNTTSGGIADLLASLFLKEGFKCIGVAYNSEKDIAEDITATTREDIIKFRGSKYIQSLTLEAFKDVVANCKSDRYAIFGTPCHIYAIDKYLRHLKIREQHILIDLYCHGCPSLLAWKKYVKEVKTKTRSSSIYSPVFRSKVEGWGRFRVDFKENGNTIYTSKNCHNEFFDIFFSDIILNDACHDCMLRSTLAYTDIRLGDFWGKQYVLNRNGVSAVSLVTDNAKELFDKLKNEVVYKEESYENLLPWQSWGKSHHPDTALRNIILEQLGDDESTLQDSLNTIYQQQSFRSRLTRYGKLILHSLPIQCEKYIRWGFYKLHMTLR